jgi:hypothetical protein
MTRLTTSEVVELFNGGWLPLGERLPPVRIIAARHPAPPPGESITIGKQIDAWVYEFFLTNLKTPLLNERSTSPTRPILCAALFGSGTWRHERKELALAA